LEKWNLSWRCL